MAMDQLREPLARSGLYELLSAGFLYPETGRAELLRSGSRDLAAVCQQLGWPDLAEPLGQLEVHLARLDDDGLELEYISVFGHTISTDCPAYETEYGKAHVFQKSQTLADLSTFYQAFGVGLNPNLKERLDHISVELEFMNLLTLKEAYACNQGHGEDKARLCRDAQQSFLVTHLAEWTNPFLGRLSRRTGGDGVYGGLGQLLDRFLSAEFARFGIDPESADQEEPPEEVEDQLDCAACPLAEDMSQGAPIPLRVMNRQ